MGATCFVGDGDGVDKIGVVSKTKAFRVDKTSSDRQTHKDCEADRWGWALNVTRRARVQGECDTARQRDGALLVSLGSGFKHVRYLSDVAVGGGRWKRKKVRQESRENGGKRWMAVCGWLMGLDD